MDLEEYKKAIEDLNYVVQRNWEKDPYLEGDLDLFVSLEDWDELLQITQRFNFPFKVDIRTHGDNYYPEDICDMLLRSSYWEAESWHDGWKIPDIEAQYYSLMYHSLVHKEDHPYEQKLRDLFLLIYPPVRANDPGVGFFNAGD